MMKPMMWNRVGLSLLGACALSACSESERPRYSSGVDQGVPVSSLDDSDLREICSSFDGYVNTYVDLDAVAYVACLPLAIITSLDDETCQNNLNNCMQLFPRPIQVSARAQNEQMCFDTLRECEASVAQLEGCVNVNVDLALNILDRLSCNRANDPAYREMVRPMANLVNVCADVNNACNTFSSVQAPD